MNIVKKTKYFFSEFLTHLRLLPLKRKIMIISILMMGINFYTAPFGLGLLMIYSLYELKQYNKIGSDKITFKLLFKESVFFVPGSILVISAFIGPIYHGNYINSLLALVVLAPLVITATVIQFIWTQEDGLHFARYAVMLILPVSVYAALFPWPGVFFIYARDDARLMGTFGNPNFFSYILELFLVVAFAVFYHAWNKNTKIRILISAMAGMVCLYFTGSRTGLVAFFIGLAVFLFAMSEKKMICALMLIVFAGLIFTALFPDNVVKIAASIFPRVDLMTEGFESRFGLWNIALRQINKNPFVGTGLYTYHNYIPVNAPSTYTSAYHAHNIFINYWLETGLPGVLSFAWILVSVGIRSIRSLIGSPFKPYLASVIAILAITFIHGLTDTPIASAQTISFFAVFLAIATTGYRKSSNP